MHSNILKNLFRFLLILCLLISCTENSIRNNLVKSKYILVLYICVPKRNSRFNIPRCRQNDMRRNRSDLYTCRYKGSITKPFCA